MQHVQTALTQTSDGQKEHPVVVFTVRFEVPTLVVVCTVRFEVPTLVVVCTVRLEVPTLVVVCTVHLEVPTLAPHLNTEGSG